MAALGADPRAHHHNMGYNSNYVRSQEHLFEKNERNPDPTTMPPPTAGLAGAALGERHVISFIGLPARGKQFMAIRLAKYLNFFHGAQCEIFDLANSDLADDDSMTTRLKVFLEEEDEQATRQLLKAMEGVEDNEMDRLKRAVDSGKIAILDTHDAFATHRRGWSGTSKERRWWMQQELEKMKVKVKLLFIEVIVNQPDVIHNFLRERIDFEAANPRSSESAAEDRRSTVLQGSTLCSAARVGSDSPENGGGGAGGAAAAGGGSGGDGDGDAEIARVGSGTLLGDKDALGMAAHGIASRSSLGPADSADTTRDTLTSAGTADTALNSQTRPELTKRPSTGGIMHVNSPAARAKRASGVEASVDVGGDEGSWYFAQGEADEERQERLREEQVEATMRRIKDFGRSFVTIQDDGSEDDLHYAKVIDFGTKVITNRIKGFMLMQIVKYVSHVHPMNRTIYLSRHGQSVYNAQKKIGGNPGLTPIGKQYAEWLGQWVPKNVWLPPSRELSYAPIATMRGAGKEHRRSGSTTRSRMASPGSIPEERMRSISGEVGGRPAEVGGVPVLQQPCRLWTSTLKRTIDTARHIPHPHVDLPNGDVWHQMSPRVYRNLDEIFAGECEGMTYAEIEEKLDREALLRKRDKLGYRYPRGESYLDLIARLDPLMHELEAYTEPLLIVSHQATLRMVYAYLKGTPRHLAPKLEIPLHTVIKIKWNGWQQVTEERIEMPMGAVGDDGQRDL